MVLFFQTGKRLNFKHNHKEYCRRYSDCLGCQKHDSGFIGKGPLIWFRGLAETSWFLEYGISMDENMKYRKVIVLNINSILSEDRRSEKLESEGGIYELDNLWIWMHRNRYFVHMHNYDSAVPESYLVDTWLSKGYTGKIFWNTSANPNTGVQCTGAAEKGSGAASVTVSVCRTGMTAFFWTGCCSPMWSASVCREQSIWIRRTIRRNIISCDRSMSST